MRASNRAEVEQPQGAQPAGQASGGSARSCILALALGCHELGIRQGRCRGRGDDADEAMRHAVVFCLHIKIPSWRRNQLLDFSPNYTADDLDLVIVGFVEPRLDRRLN